MQTLSIEIKNPSVEQLLRELAALDLIGIRSANDGRSFPEAVLEETPSKLSRPLAGYGKGLAVIHPAFYEPLEEFKEYE